MGVCDECWLWWSSACLNLFDRHAAKSESGTKTGEANFNFHIPSKSKLNLAALLWLRTSNGSIHSEVILILIMVS